MGVTPFSDPPVIIARASPRRIVSQASPIVLLLVAQAETAAQFGPFAPVILETMPGAPSTIIMFGKCGLMRSGPFSKRTLNWLFQVDKSQTQLPIYITITIT